tara:strand:+ start:1248 stop:1523 length:276 start_codon:yes stop_codon:yes gene_type:complete
MTPSDKAVYESLVRIRNLPELAPFKTLLEQELASEVSAMTAQSDEKAMWRAQGAVRVLTKLKNLIEGSKDILDKPRPLAVVSGSYLSSNSP